MGETAARKRSRQESGVPWTPGWAHASGDTRLSAGGWWSQGGRMMNAPGATPCRAGAGPPEGVEAESLHSRWLQCPRWSRKGEGGAGTPTQVRAGVLHKLLCDAGGGLSVSAPAWWGWWERLGPPAGRGPFAPGTIGSWFR